MSITAILLTKDEILHIERALRSLVGVADRVIVVDSGSSDGTQEEAERLGATVYVRPWRNYADQFAWAMGKVPGGTQWIIRLDADEYIEENFRRGLRRFILAQQPEVSGILLRRSIIWMGQKIRWGGISPQWVIRVVRARDAKIEQRWMDENFIVKGRIARFREGGIVDHNLKPLTWWVSKHNWYASREAADLLLLELTNGVESQGLVQLRGGLRSLSIDALRRLAKDLVYRRMPPGARALLYLFYRLVLRGGFLDGPRGISFHLLQGGWYRYLVDMKVQEVRRAIAADPSFSVKEAIRCTLLLDLKRGGDLNEFSKQMS